MSTKREETRERILAAARRLLVERGPHGVGVAEIARAAGVTRQAVYGHHFASKSDLLIALVNYVDRVEKLAETFRPVVEARSALEALDRLVRAVAATSPKIYDLARVLDAARATDPAAEDAWQDRMRIRRTGITGMVKRLHRERRLKAGWSVATAVDLVWTVLSIQAYQLWVRECGWTSEQYIERVSELLHVTLIRRPAPRAPKKKARNH